MAKKDISTTLFGGPKDVHDPKIFHKLSLIPILAWVGLGADGLSSSAYGPEAAYMALGSHYHLAIFLAMATALTVFIISYAYSRIIEHFPAGGGGYIVATHTLGERAGVISGSALLVDYILTITVSIASCGDALFSFLPLSLHHLKLPFEMLMVLLLIVLNIRGVKESIAFLAPIFVTFILTHILLIGYGIFSHLPQVASLSSEVRGDFRASLATLGWAGLLAVMLRAYSLGGGTYTGIEAVSNGLQIMREPRVRNGKRTMVYLSTSLAVTAGGLLLCYVLLRVQPVAGMTLNAVIADRLFRPWAIGSLLAVVTILSEGALLLVGAQTGFIDGPRVMANMAVDSWFPHRFASLSQRLTMRNGVMLMGGSAILLLLYTRGQIGLLVVMYSINVFLTFSLSEFGMARFFVRNRRRLRHWKRQFSVQLVGFALCMTILVITTIEKFPEGGWLTLVITFLVIALCYVIRGHYRGVFAKLNKLDEILLDISTSHPVNAEEVDPRKSTAIQLVNGFNGLGVHTMLSIVRNFPGLYKNIVFVSVAVVDSGAFKGEDEVRNLESNVRGVLQKYVDLARRLGIAADWRMATGTDVIETAVSECQRITREFPRSAVFTGQLTFRLEKFYHRFLHNETAFAIQRRLHWQGVTSVILPIKIDA